MNGDGSRESLAGQAIVSLGAPRRALALIVSLALVGMLGIGWLVDGLTSTPTAATSETLSEQVGLTTVTLIASPSPLHAQHLETFILRMTDVSGARVVGARARCALSMPAMGMELPSETAAMSRQPGEYVCGPQTLDVGVWSLAVTITLADGTVGHTTFHLNVT